MSSTVIKVPTNTELDVIGITDNNWLLVKYNGTIGYIENINVVSLLQKAQDLYPELGLTELNPKSLSYVNTPTNLRTGNCIECKAISTLERYETVRILGEYNYWYLVLTNEGDIGFIPLKHTKSIKDNCIVVDKSMSKLYYYLGGDLSYISSITNTTDTSSGFYPIIKRISNGLFISSNDKNTIGNTSFQYSVEPQRDIKEELDKEPQILLHR